jgi:hypothetical protein
MFIRKRIGGGYDRYGQQWSGRGDYLALFSWNDYKAADEIRAACPTCTLRGSVRQAAIDGGDHAANLWPRYCDDHCGMHSGLPLPKYANGYGKLWATVRSCSLHQLGHFMMGSIYICGKQITVSGPIGHDGLPLDLQDVPAAWRERLIEVPEAVAAVYWQDTGHNDVGSAAPTLREWALRAFPPKGGSR